MERRQSMAIRNVSDKLRTTGWLATWQRLREQQLRRHLLAHIDTSLVWHDASLINTRSGESRPVHAGSGSLAEALAAAAAELLAQQAPPGGILLLLPPACVAATPFDLAVRELGSENLLRSALLLQAPQLLPACEEPLLLALDARRPRGVALWCRAGLADALHAAFQARGLPLLALMPRPLAAPLPCIDRDADTRTLACSDEGALSEWLTLALSDLQEPAFVQQWDEHCRARGVDPAAGCDADYWRRQRYLVQPQSASCFIPPAAQAAAQSRERHRTRRVAGLALAACLAVLVLPFIVNQLRLQWLERELEAGMQASTAARASQAAVVAMEEAWAPVLRYPRQDLASALVALDRHIDDGLSSFSIDRGVIDISGFVPDPALLVEQLADEELFYGVTQSRSSSGSGEGGRGARFGIRMQLSGADFPAWEAVLAGAGAVP